MRNHEMALGNIEPNKMYDVHITNKEDLKALCDMALNYGIGYTFTFPNTKCVFVIDPSHILEGDQIPGAGKRPLKKDYVGKKPTIKGTITACRLKEPEAHDAQKMLYEANLALWEEDLRSYNSGLEIWRENHESDLNRARVYKARKKCIGRLSRAGKLFGLK